MRLAAYARTKPTGVSWLGDVPEHWQVMKLHHMVRMRSGESITSLDLDDEGAFPVFGGNGVRGKYSGYTHDGSYVLIGRQGAECGNINYAAGKFWASEHAVVATPDRELHHRWLGETLRAMNLNQYSQSAAQPGLSVEVIGRLKLPFPPYSEQRQIAAFLDWKTGQIDGLITQKRKLLEKLKEKRLAVITQAVTKGLNSAAPLKDSGIPWLGQVPKDWGVRRLRFLAEAIDQGWSPKASNCAAEGEELGVLKLSAVSHGEFVPAENKMLEEVPENQMVLSPRKHDLLITRANTPELVGDACPVSENFPHLIVPDLIYRITLDRAASDERFAAYFLLSKEGRAQIEAEARGSSGSMVKLGQGHLKNFQIPAPSLDEQRSIVTYLDEQVGRIDKLFQKINQAVVRLAEYRTALITAATTGKIDVRNVEIPQPASR